MTPEWIRSSTTMRAALAAGRRHFGYAALFSALLNLLFIAPMLYMLQVYDRVMPTQGRTTLVMLTLILAVSLATLAALEAIRSRLLVRASVRLDQVLAGPIMRATLLQPDSSQRLARQAVREFDVLRQALTGPAMLGVLDAPWVPIYVLIAFLIHPWIGVLTLSGALLIVLLAWRSERVTREPLQQANLAAGRSYAAYDASVASSDVVRALGLREAMVVGHIGDRRTMMELQTDAGMTSAKLTAHSKFVRLLLQSLALGVGALLAIDAKVSAGAVFASMFIVGRALAPIDQLVGGWRTVIQARGAINVLDELFATTPPDIARTRLPAPTGRLDVEGLTVVGQGQKPILYNIGFSVAPGEVVAIVGPSGAGKSTLAELTSGLLRPDAGAVLLGSIPLTEIDERLLRRTIALVPQEAYVFAGTIRENVMYLQPAATDADALAAIVAVGAQDLVHRMGGLQAELEPGGGGLSAGERQLVALARTYLAPAQVVILDEATCHLDPVAEAHAERAFRDRPGTLVVIAHRMSSALRADRILVMDGSSAKLNRHAELLEAGGLYADLVGHWRGAV